MPDMKVTFMLVTSSYRFLVCFDFMRNDAHCWTTRVSSALYTVNVTHDNDCGV